MNPYDTFENHGLFDTVEIYNSVSEVSQNAERAMHHCTLIYELPMTDDQLAELAPWSEKLQSIKNRM